MKKLKLVLVIFGGLILALIVISQFMPGSYHVERSVVVAAKPEAIFPWINELKKWQEWSPWTATKDPTVVYAYEGPESGVGAISKWDSKKWGDGRMQITEADPQKGVKFDLSFNKGKNVCTANFIFAPSGQDTKVTWAMDGTVSRNPIERLMTVLMEKFVGPDFEEGLKALKKRVETP